MENNTLIDLIKKTRSVRRFDESVPIREEVLRTWIGNLRYTSSARNLQPLKYKIVTEKDDLELIYPLLHWAGYLKDWDGPSQGERPTAFVIQLVDTDIATSARFDEGIQLEALMLQATAEGWSGCIIQAFNAAKLVASLSIPERFSPLSVIAFGKGIEQIVIEKLIADGSVQYWRTADGVHHVPKRIAEELIIA